MTVNTTVSTLKKDLEDALQRTVDFPGTISDLVLEAARYAGVPTGPTGFPGFRDEPESKGKFEQIIERLST